MRVKLFNNFNESLDNILKNVSEDEFISINIDDVTTLLDRFDIVDFTKKMINNLSNNVVYRKNSIIIDKLDNSGKRLVMYGISNYGSKCTFRINALSDEYFILETNYSYYLIDGFDGLISFFNKNKIIFSDKIRKMNESISSSIDDISNDDFVKLSRQDTHKFELSRLPVEIVNTNILSIIQRNLIDNGRESIKIDSYSMSHNSISLYSDPYVSNNISIYKFSDNYYLCYMGKIDMDNYYLCNDISGIISLFNYLNIKFYKTIRSMNKKNPDIIYSSINESLDSSSNVSLKDKLDFLVNIAYSINHIDEDYSNLWGKLSSIFGSNVDINKNRGKITDDVYPCPFIYEVDNFLNSLKNKYNKQDKIDDINSLWDNFKDFRGYKYSVVDIENMLSNLLYMDHFGGKLIDKYKIRRFYRIFDKKHAYFISIFLHEELFPYSNPVDLSKSKLTEWESIFYRYKRMITPIVKKICNDKFSKVEVDDSSSFFKSGQLKNDGYYKITILLIE